MHELLQNQTNNWKLHPNAHHFLVWNKQRRESAEMFQHMTNIFSIDATAKLKAGPPAVSRYH